MNFGKNDFYILVGSFVVIVFMTLVFPALGMTNNSANESNVPELDISKNTVNLVGERPEFPRSPSSGELRYRPEQNDNTQDILHDNGDYEVYLDLYCDSHDPANETCQVLLTVFHDSQSQEDKYILSESDFNESGTHELEADNNNSETWEVRVSFDHMENWNTSDLDMRVGWELESSPEGGSWIENIPILGGIYSTADALASIVGWGISVIFWFCAWFVELVINVLGMLINLFFFILNLLGYMITNYNDMLQNVTGIATFILSIPAILLTVELLKVGFIFIKILPTT